MLLAHRPFPQFQYNPEWFEDDDGDDDDDWDLEQFRKQKEDEDMAEEEARIAALNLSEEYHEGDTVGNGVRNA